MALVVLRMLVDLAYVVESVVECVVESAVESVVEYVVCSLLWLLCSFE